MRNSSDGSGFRLRISYNSYMAVCFVFGVGESASYRLTIRMVYLVFVTVCFVFVAVYFVFVAVCVLYLLRCILYL